jgi:hypothetical protein
VGGGRPQRQSGQRGYADEEEGEDAIWMWLREGLTELKVEREAVEGELNAEREEVEVEGEDAVTGAAV